MQTHDLTKAEEAAVKNVAEAIGFAVSTWAYAEDLLAGLYQLCFGGFEPQLTAIAFQKTKGINTRLSAITEALKALEIPENELSKWNNLYNRMTSKGKLRDKIAHAQILAYTDKDGEAVAVITPFTGWNTQFLKAGFKPSDLSSEELIAKRYTGNNSPLKIDRITEFTDSLVILAAELDAFATANANLIMNQRLLLARKGGLAPRIPAPNAPSHKPE